MRAVVTGGAGFIGSHVVDALVAAWGEVHVLDDFSKGKRGNVPEGVHVHEGDIRSDAGRVFDEVRPEVCFHLAAQADVRVSVEQPDFDADVNVIGTVQILEAARKHGTKIVFSSTGGAIYGECDAPAREDHPRAPLAPYGVSKLAGEEYIAAYNRLYGAAHVTLRYGNVYGPRQDPKGEAGVVAIFMKLLRDGGTPRIFGDGTQTRDYVYVGDVVAATVAAAEHAGGVLNVGMGVETSVVELYDRIQRVAGVEREPQFAEPRPGELQRSVLDASLAKRELGWEPQHSLDEGLAETWAWISSSKGPVTRQGPRRAALEHMRPSAVSRVPRSRLWKRSHTSGTRISSKPAIRDLANGPGSPGRKRTRPFEGARPRGTNSLRAMQHAQDLDLDVIRPWRRATIAVSVVASVELVVLAAIAIVLLGNPLASHLRETAAVAGTPRVRTANPAPAKKAALDRAETSVMVLNGGGRSGAAHAAADRVSAHGYQLGQVGNAAGDTPRTLIMYRRGYEAEGARLGRDLHVRIVRPLDGMRPVQLLGAHLVLIMGR